jgi:hypothetical protein
MNIRNIPVPDIYTDSQDFRFFLDWFTLCLEKTQYDTENLLDLYDPLRCPAELLWMLADTMGYVYDDRLPVSFNRLVLVYFMSMIYNRGSRDGMILAAETNLAQFRINMTANGYIDSHGEYHEGKEILNERLEDTSIPVNSVSVIPHPELGYIDLVYFSEEEPIDACIEYVRPIGMYLFSGSGISLNANAKICVDARLTDRRDMKMSIGPTFVGHYSRNDYARLQREGNDPRKDVWHNNSVYEVEPDSTIHPGLRSLYSLQISNNEEIVRSLLPTIFSIGFNPQTVDETFPDDYREHEDLPEWNLRYDSTTDAEITTKANDGILSVQTIDPNSPDILHPNPAVNPVMTKLGDALSS